ncbi:hypothetical protein ACIGII_17015 [Stenotrophomonas sp. NPDC077420]|uniref:hypothetical protein n=1 Tax=Stenotrophomonas sp. NPDC077420 TaxID=3364532 RepID=UPI0037CF0C16
MNRDRKSFTVRTVKADECIHGLPTLSALEDFDCGIDILILAAGFEERVLAVPGLIASGDVGRIQKILVGRYRTNADDNSARYCQLEPVLTSIGYEVVEFSADDPYNVSYAIDYAVRELSRESTRVLLDISGASSTMIVAAMSALVKAAGHIALTVTYAEAEIYDCPAEIDGESRVTIQRESGVSSDPLYGSFTGHHHDHLPASVIAIPSMYTDRLEACLAHLNVGPITGSEDNLFWVRPATSASQHTWRQEHTRRAVEDLVRRLQGRDGEPGEEGGIRPDDMAVCDTLDYADTVRLLISRIDTLSGRNISIAHMGSKLQAVGVALAAAARSEVSVLTARPASFNAKSYSKGVGKLHQLHFVDLGSTLNSIASIGSLRIP